MDPYILQRVRYLKQSLEWISHRDHHQLLLNDQTFQEDLGLKNDKQLKEHLSDL